MTKTDDYHVRAMLALFRVSGERDTLDRLHHTIEREITKSFKAVEKAKTAKNQDYLDAIIDDECDQIEQLLGLAFVAAQVFVNKIRTRWTKTVPDDVKRRFRGGSEPSDLLKKSPLHAGSKYHVVEVINAVANYWKHSEEWPIIEASINVKGRRGLRPMWDLHSTKESQKYTVEIITDLGMSCGSTGNLRHAVEVLGVQNCGDLSALRKILFDWADSLYEETRAEIRNAIGKPARKARSRKPV